MATTEYGRTWNTARKVQGFTSQAQLDAFYAERDHVESCTICSRVGGYVALDDGLQPFMNSCQIGKDLHASYLRTV